MTSPDFSTSEETFLNKPEPIVNPVTGDRMTNYSTLSDRFSSISTTRVLDDTSTPGD